MSEDVFFLLDFLDKCECAVGVPGAFYCYCRNGESLSKSYRGDRFEKCRLIIDGINEVLSKRMDESVYKIYTDRLLQAYAPGGLYAGNSVFLKKRPFESRA